MATTTKVSCYLVLLLVFAAWFVSVVADEPTAMENAMHDVKETTDSWAEWAKEKWEGLGIGKGDDEEATKTTEKVSDIASGMNN